MLSTMVVISVTVAPLRAEEAEPQRQSSSGVTVFAERNAKDKRDQLEQVRTLMKEVKHKSGSSPQEN